MTASDVVCSNHNRPTIFVNRGLDYVIDGDFVTNANGIFHNTYLKAEKMVTNGKIHIQNNKDESSGITKRHLGGTEADVTMSDCNYQAFDGHTYVYSQLPYNPEQRTGILSEDDDLSLIHISEPTRPY